VQLSLNVLWRRPRLAIPDESFPYRLRVSEAVDKVGLSWYIFSPKFDDSNELGIICLAGDQLQTDFFQCYVLYFPEVSFQVE
jgi:hypothetical protein